MRTLLYTFLFIFLCANSLVAQNYYYPLDHTPTPSNSGHNETTYYVSSTGGNDGNSGRSEETAWKTLAKVNSSTFSPGDIISFKRGDTWREQLTIPSSGTSGSYISFAAYGTGNKPRILGSEIETSWTNTYGNIWESVQTFTDPYALQYDGNVFFIETNEDVTWGRVKKANTGACVTEYDWTWASNHIYIYSPTDPNTNYSGVEITQRRYGIALNEKNNIEIDNLEVAYVGKQAIGELWKPFETSVTGLTVKNCHVHHTNIKGNHGYGVESWHSNTLIKDNIIHDNGRRNISLNLYDNGVDVSNVIVEGNTLYNSFHTTGLDLTTSGTSSWTNVTFRNNYVYNEITDDIDSIENYGSGFVYCAPEAVDNTVNGVYIYNNIFKGVTAKGIALGSTYGTNDVYIYNNTFYGVSPYITGTYSNMILVQFGSDAVIKNNIFYNDVNIGENPTFYVIGTTADAGTVIVDNNLYYNTSATKLMIWMGTNYSVSQWETYKSVSGLDANSIISKDPLFVSSSDYNLQSGSPAINEGVDVGLDIDYKGNPIIGAPDMGAFENFN